MSKDQCHMQTLRTFYLYGILSPQDLFIAERSALKRASRWLLKQMITLSGSWDISNLVSGNLVITDWSADNLVNTDCFETFLVPFGRLFLRAFGSHLDHQNQSSISRVIVQMKFVTRALERLTKGQWTGWLDYKMKELDLEKKGWKTSSRDIEFKVR